MADSSKTHAKTNRFHPRHLLLLLPYAALCFPSLYARATPEFFGVPFFYCYQFFWVALTSALLCVYYRLIRCLD